MSGAELDGSHFFSAVKETFSEDKAMYSTLLFWWDYLYYKKI